MKALECSKCGRVVDNLDNSTIKVTCSYCVLSIVGMPTETKQTYRPTGRPSGWHFMKEFVDKDGNVFHKGVEQPDLKGTLEPTIVIRTKVKTKRRTQEQILLDREKEKKVALKKAMKKQVDFINHNFGD